MTDRYATLRQGLIGAWCPSLGATGYTLLDRSGRNSHGTLTNMGGQVNWQASGDGLALNFDGSNDHVVNAAPNYAVTFPLQITLWARISSAYRNASLGRTYLVQATSFGGSAQSLFSIATDYSNSTDRLYYFENNTVRLTTQAFTVNAWQHIAFCFDSSSTVRFFLNGIQGTIAQPGATGFPSLGQPGLYIGGLDGTAINCPALVDDIRFYNRTLTAAEVGLLASRRGIGLLPTRHRRAKVLGSQFWLNVSGTWKKATPFIKVAGEWEQATPKLNVSGTWK